MSFAVVALGLVVAIPVGLVAGYRGGRVDAVLMRLCDAALSFPPLVLALAVAGVLGPGTNNVVLALAIVFVPGLIRLVRGAAFGGAHRDVHRSIAHRRHADPAHPRPACVPERPLAADRPGVVRARRRPPGRGRPQLPRPRSPPTGGQSPLARGMLAGNRRRSGEVHSHRAATDPASTRFYDDPHDFDVVDRVVEVADKRGVVAAQIALAWLLQKPAVTAPIIGATKVSHVDEAWSRWTCGLTTRWPRWRSAISLTRC